MTSNNLFYWLSALYMPNIGPYKILKWLQYFSTLEKLFNASVDELESAGIEKKYIQTLKNPNQKLIEKDLAWAQAETHFLLAYEDEDYPSLLKAIADPPLVIYGIGNKQALSRQQIAIVGSRHATPQGLTNAEQFAYCLAASGFTITSGLAAGIDGASHRGALKAKGVTISVMGTGLLHIYPASHQSLVDEMICHEGAVISELPLNTAPQAKNFPKRNRIISGLSMGVLVVEAALKSGSLITARHALEQGREVFAIPGSIHQPLARGCHHLIQQGAKLVETADDILEELGAFRPRVPFRSNNKQTKQSSTLSPESWRLLEQISYDITPLDMIILRSGLTVEEVSSILLTLELSGYVQSVMGGYIRVIID